MPLTPTYTWNETPNEVTIKVNTSASDTKKPPDVVVGDCFVRINRSPYVFVLDLYDVIVSDTASVVVNDMDVMVTMQKCTTGVWGELKATGTKVEIQNRREESMLRHEQAQKERRDAQVQARVDLKKRAHEKQWQIERQQKETVAQLKNRERREAESDLESFKRSVESGESSVVDAESSKKSVRPIRKTATIQARFTAVKGPARVSKVKRMVDEKLANMSAPKVGEPTAAADGGDTVATQSNANTNVHDQHSLMLKDKGDKFFKAKAFDAALNAYSESLKLDSANVLCWSSRAACLLRLAEQDDGVRYRELLQLSVRDVTKALELLPGEHKHRSVLLHRRGVAYSWLGNFSQACVDFKEARANFNSDDTDEVDGELWIEDCQRDLDTACKFRDRLNAGDDKTLLQEASVAVDAKVAVTKLTECLTINPTNVSALLQRAMKLATIGKHHACIQDCNHALGLLREAGDFVDRKLMDTAYMLRGTARSWLCETDDAITDFENVDTDDARENIERLQKHQQCQDVLTQANAQFENGKYRVACRSYTKALHITSGEPMLLSNRAACHLKLDDVAACVNDCDAALRVLKGTNDDKKLPYAPARVQWWTCITLVRRGSARCWMGHWTEGRSDYVEALSLMTKLQQQSNSDTSTDTQRRLLDFNIDLEEDLAMIDAQIDKLAHT